MTFTQPQADMILSSSEEDDAPAAPSRGGKKGAKGSGGAGAAAGLTALQAVLASDNEVVKAVQVGIHRIRLGSIGFIKPRGKAGVLSKGDAGWGSACDRRCRCVHERRQV